MTTNTTTPATELRPRIDLKELAYLAGIGVSTAERLAAADKLPPCIHVGGSRRLRRYDRALVELWLSWGCPPRVEFEARLAAEQKK